MQGIRSIVESIGNIKEISLVKVTVAFTTASGSRIYALRSIDLTFEQGVTVLLGPNGAGKTTMLNVLSGMVRPNIGRVVINDVIDLSGLPGNLRALLRRKHYAYLLQQDIHIEHFKVLDNILLPFMVFGEKPPMENVVNIADKLGIRELLDRSPYELSGGERRKVSIARALLKAEFSTVVLLDEPTSNLDRESVDKLIDIIREIGKKKIVVVATHDHALIDSADKAVYMRYGSIENIRSRS